MTKTKLIKTASGMEVEQDGKSYPVRSEDEEGFMELALHEFCKQNNKDERFVSEFSIPFVKALSQGIEIPSERVKLQKYGKCCWQTKDHPYHNPHCEGFKCKDGYSETEYATLLTEDKEGEGQGDLWDELFDHIENTPVDVPWADCIKELKQKFKITKK